MPLLLRCFGKDYHYTSFSPIKSNSLTQTYTNTHTHTHTHDRLHTAHAYPLPISCLKIDLFLNDLSASQSSRLQDRHVHGVKCSPSSEELSLSSLYPPPPHHRSLSHTYTHILRAAHSGCRWQLVCARQETLCTQLVNRESGSLTCRRRVSSSPGE